MIEPPPHDAHGAPARTTIPSTRAAGSGAPDEPEPPLAAQGPGEAHTPGREVLGRSARWRLFALVSVALFMASMDGTIVATALPTLRHSLHASVDVAGWTLTVYMLGQTMTMPVAGRVSDLLGRKRVFLSSVALFTAASLACGLAVDIYLLIGLRFVQSLGGGAIMPSATGIIADRFGEGRDRAIALFSSILPLGVLIGPIVGGLVVSYASWREIFFINVPIGIGLVALSARRLPRIEPLRRARPDLPGALLLGALLLAAMVAVTTLGSGSTSPWSAPFLLPLALAGGLAVAFVRRSGHVSVPILPLRLLAAQEFRFLNVINLAWGLCALGVSTMIPLYAEDRYGFDPLRAGTLLTTRAVGMLATSVLAAVALRRTGYRVPIALSMAVQAAGLLLVASRPMLGSTYGWLALGTAVMGLGVGVGNPALTNAGLSLAPKDAAAITGLRGMFRQSGGILAISIITALVARQGGNGIAFARMFLVFAAVSLLVVPLVLKVPNGKGMW
ncbi:MAG TPA: MFS transporter [Acidimicrobiales bacterium]|nr:MFS transporter [Acidimicrobiales bacterium]